MKLPIGEKIRTYRREKEMTQEQLAERLGVACQSVSRWEGGSGYPDLELLPAIAELFEVSMDELLGMPERAKEKKAKETYDALRLECMKKDYNADRIVELLREIRRNYLKSRGFHRPFTEGNERAFRDPKILPEVRLLAEAHLALDPMNPNVLRTMANVEDEEHLEPFLDKHTTYFDCSARTLLFDRYLRNGDRERFEKERRYQFCTAVSKLLCPIYFPKEEDGAEAGKRFRKSLLLLLREASEPDDAPDMWIEERLDFDFSEAARFAKEGMREEALARLDSAIRLLENTMKITEKVVLPTSCRFLDGMEWTAIEDWQSPINAPGEQERFIFISTQMRGVTTCYCIYPSNYLPWLRWKAFDALREDPRFQALQKRVEALIVIRDEDASANDSKEE